MKKVLCAGLVVCDIPLRPIPRSLLRRDACMIEAPRPSTGGDALNVAVTLTKLGLKASLCGLVGNDANGDFILKTLDAAGVGTGGISRHPSLGTVVSYILIESDGKRHFIVYNDLSAVFSRNHIPDALIEEADMVYFGSAMCMEAMDRGGAAAFFKKAHELGKITVADTAAVETGRDSAYYLELLGPMLRETDVFIPSHEEAVILTGKEDLPDIRRVLAPYGFTILVVKLGRKGCYVTDFKNEWTIPTFPEFKPLDTTGAGDSFTGGFIRGLAEGWTPEASAVFANAVASFNVTKLGATGGVPGFDTAYRYVTERRGGAH
ncbi:MAG: sugar kinase, partial [Treponema sp.]|nr:sugar kinase [Treponema sp.]